jgi:signal transduction histidine kinase/DNA-binding response OmpR family regulator
LFAEAQGVTVARILIVDDRPIDRQLLVTLLGYGGHHLLEATDGLQALHLARSEHPELIITDIVMPILDGFELVRQLRDDPSTAQTSVVFYTANYLETEARTLAGNVGVSHLLFKPCEPQEILSIVGEALRVLPMPSSAIPSEETYREHLQMLTTKLSRKLDVVLPQLTALIELGQQLPWQHNLPRLFENFCHAARTMLSTQVAGISLLSEDGQTVRYQFTSNLNNDSNAEVEAAIIPLMDKLLVAEGPLHSANFLDGTHSFLGTPVLSSIRRYGWLYLVDRVDGQPFTQEDEQLVIALAGYVAMASENERYFIELEREVIERRRAVQVRDEFLSIAAHELKTPVTSLRGFAQTLLRYLDKHGTFQVNQLQHGLRIIDQQAVKLSTLVSQLLDISRFQAGHLELEWAKTDLTRLVTEAVMTVQRNTERHTFTVQAPSSLLVWIDPLRIEQVLINLLDNAIKYSPGGGPVYVELSVLAEHSMCLTVTDHGLGIPVEHRQQIFDRFYQAHKDGSIEGLGLGLYISRQIVDLHGGQIWVDTPSEGGTRFVIQLPIGEGNA